MYDRINKLVQSEPLEGWFAALILSHARRRTTAIVYVYSSVALMLSESRFRVSELLSSSTIQSGI